MLKRLIASLRGEGGGVLTMFGYRGAPRGLKLCLSLDTENNRVIPSPVKDIT